MTRHSQTGKQRGEARRYSLIGRCEDKRPASQSAMSRMGRRGRQTCLRIKAYSSQAS